jgi:hypothetical protein
VLVAGSLLHGGGMFDRDLGRLEEVSDSAMRLLVSFPGEGGGWKWIRCDCSQCARCLTCEIYMESDYSLRFHAWGRTVLVVLEAIGVCLYLEVFSCQPWSLSALVCSVSSSQYTRQISKGGLSMADAGTCHPGSMCSVTLHHGSYLLCSSPTAESRCQTQCQRDV